MIKRHDDSKWVCTKKKKRYVPNDRASKYMKQNLTEIKGEGEKYQKRPTEICSADF